MGTPDPLEPTGASSSFLSQEEGERGTWYRGGEGWFPILGLTLELRSSRRFPALLLRSLMDGDRSRFLIRLVMVDPSTAIMMKSPGTILGPILGLVSTAALPFHSTESSSMPSH